MIQKSRNEREGPYYDPYSPPNQQFRTLRKQGPKSRLIWQRYSNNIDRYEQHNSQQFFDNHYSDDCIRPVRDLPESSTTEKE